MVDDPQIKSYRDKLPGVLRAMRLYNTMVDRSSLFNDTDAKKELNVKAQPEWVKQLHQLTQGTASENASRDIIKSVETLVDLSRQVVERGASGKAPAANIYESMLLAREGVYEALSEAGPAKLGGAAAEMVNTYRRWTEDVTYSFIFQPDEGKYEAGQMS